MAIQPTTSFSKGKKRAAQASAIFVSKPACQWGISHGMDKVLFLPGPGDGLERNIKQKRMLGFEKFTLIEYNAKIRDYLVEKLRRCHGWQNPEKYVHKVDVFEYLDSLSDTELCRYGQLDIDIFTCFREEYYPRIQRYLGCGIPSIWLTIDMRGGNEEYKKAAEQRLGFDLADAGQEVYVKLDMERLVRSFPEYNFGIMKYPGNRTNNQGSTMLMLVFWKNSHD
jgi:hypothetical protein